MVVQAATEARNRCGLMHFADVADEFYEAASPPGLFRLLGVRIPRRAGHRNGIVEVAAIGGTAAAAKGR